MSSELLRSGLRPGRGGQPCFRSSPPAVEGAFSCKCCFWASSCCSLIRLLSSRYIPHVMFERFIGMLESVVPWGPALLSHIPTQVSHDSPPNGLTWKDAGKERALHSCVLSSRESRDSRAPRSSSMMLEAPCSTVRAPACGMTSGRHAETTSQSRVRQWITDLVGGGGQGNLHVARRKLYAVKAIGSPGNEWCRVQLTP
jgi:hypothetical protein